MSESGSTATGPPNATGPSAPTGPGAAAPGLIEKNGIEVISESERTGKPSDLFWPWFAANISVFGVSWGAFVLDFGISFAQALVVSTIGVAASFLICGIIAIAGKRGSAPTMILSRAPFGYYGQKVPGVVSWLLSIGWETVLAILATLATATVFERLGLGGGTLTKVIAALLIAGLIVVAAVLGYHVIVKLQSVLTWVTGGLSLVYIVMTLDQIDLDAVAAMPAGPTTAVIGALIMVMTGFGLGWVNIAADWSRYLPRGTPGRQVVGWNTLGGSIGPILLIAYGLLIAGTSPDLKEAIAVDPIGALASALPTWFLIPFLIVAVLGLVSGAILGIYSSGLTLLSLGVNIPRPAAALLDGILLSLGTFYVVFVADSSFYDQFQGFLTTLGVPIAAWAGIMMADILLRRKDYDDAALFTPKGRYGAVAWSTVAVMGVASVVGWGLVTNTYASWLQWQGYLLGPLGLGGREGDWAFANLGVLVSLALGFLGYLIFRRGAVRRQEADAPRAVAGDE